MAFGANFLVDLSRRYQLWSHRQRVRNVLITELPKLAIGFSVCGFSVLAAGGCVPPVSEDMRICHEEFLAFVVVGVEVRAMPGVSAISWRQGASFKGIRISSTPSRPDSR